MQKCRIWQSARAGLSPECVVGKMDASVQAGTCKKVVCVTICNFFHGMTGKLKQLATEKGLNPSSSKAANAQSFIIRK